MIKSPPELRALAFDLSVAAWSLAAIGFLFESGLADQLVEPRTIDELATTFPAPRIQRILDVAASHGVVVVDGGRYRLAEGVAPVVCGPLRVTFAADMRSHLMQPLALLDAAKSRDAKGWQHTDPVLLQAQGDASSVLPAMIKMAIAPHLGDLAARLERPGCKLLDIGTGVGALAIAACKVYPQLAVVGIDTADAPLALARANVARAGLGDRIELRQHPAEELRDEGTFTLAWLPLFFVARDQQRAVLARAVAALEPGGWLLVGTGGTGDAKQSAVWRLITEMWGGPTDSNGTTESLLREAGLHDVLTMPGPPWSAQMIAGQRPVAR